MEGAMSRDPASSSPSITWTALAGSYAFLWSAILMRLLAPLSDTLVMLIAPSTEYSALILAGPVVVIGAVVWWLLVERRQNLTYASGVAFGLVTAVSTVLFWVLWFAVEFGSAVVEGWVIILFLLLVSLPVGLLAGLTLVFARRWLAHRRLDGEDGTPG